MSESDPIQDAQSDIARLCEPEEVLLESDAPDEQPPAPATTLASLASSSTFIAGMESPVLADKPKRGRQKKPKKIVQEAAILTVTRFRPPQFDVGVVESAGEIISEQIEVRAFQTDAARVRVQRMCSIEIGEGSEWQGVRVTIELPCYTEEIPQALEWAERTTKEQLSQYRRKIILETMQRAYGQPLVPSAEPLHVPDSGLKDPVQKAFPDKILPGRQP